MKYVYNCFICFIIVLSVSSCTPFKGSDTIHYFTISMPQPLINKKEKAAVKARIKVCRITADGVYGRKMYFTAPPNGVFFDSCNCWAQKPAVMLTNYFSIYLGSRMAPEGKVIKVYYSLSGKILSFDANMKTKKAKLMIKLQLENNNGKILIDKIYTVQKRMKKLTASDFAQAMTEASRETASLFYQDLKKQF
ncbi:MAG: hypothetical protein K9M56_05060 [Victivallales bacterium]|nr:hypothetical protein [Victivallales bacterium]